MCEALIGTFLVLLFLVVALFLTGFITASWNDQ